MIAFEKRPTTYNTNMSTIDPWYVLQKRHALLRASRNLRVDFSLSISCCWLLGKVEDIATLHKDKYSVSQKWLLTQTDHTPGFHDRQASLCWWRGPYEALFRETAICSCNLQLEIQGCYLCPTTSLWSPQSLRKSLATLFTCSGTGRWIM